MLHHRGGCTVASDFAKAHPAEFGALACLGFITTDSPSGFCRRWRLTARGLAHLESL